MGRGPLLAEVAPQQRPRPMNACLDVGGAEAQTLADLDVREAVQIEKHAIRFQYDQKIAAQMILARVLWLQGFPEQAMQTAQANVEEARTVDHAVSLCNALEIPPLGQRDSILIDGPPATSRQLGTPAACRCRACRAE